MSAALTTILLAEELLQARSLTESLEAFAEAEASGAEADRCAAGRWKIYMLQGKYESAWVVSDGIRRRGQPDPHRFWNGESIAGKRVILRCLHGFGDAVQFLRYAGALKSVTSHLIVEVAPRFVELARRFDGVGEVVTWGTDAPIQAPKWEVQIEVMELPYLFRTQVGELPILTRYLNIPREEAAATSEKQTAVTVGLAWGTGEWNPKRALSLELLRPVLCLKDCEYWSLLGGPERVGQEEPLEAEFMQVDEASRGSIDKLAERIAKLDLVITVDTLAAHLAGALGVPCWVMLQHEADWRWMHHRDDTPWYPTIRLFRQSTPDDWQGVVKSIQIALIDFVSLRAGESGARSRE